MVRYCFLYGVVKKVRFFGIYKDMIKIGIPIENNYLKDVILVKIKKAIRNSYTIYLKL